MTGFDITGGEALNRARWLADELVQPPPVAPLQGGDDGSIGSVAPGDGDSSDFGSALAEALQEVSDLGNETKNKAEALARGEPVEIHDLMVAMGKSEVAFNLMLEVRNKIVEAWHTLSRSVS